jgi:hypothetical protein
VQCPRLVRGSTAGSVVRVRHGLRNGRSRASQMCSTGRTALYCIGGPHAGNFREMAVATNEDHHRPRAEALTADG